MTEADYFEQEARLYAEFLERLEHKPTVEISGMIRPNGAALISSGVLPQWTTVFFAIAWRIAGGEIQNIPLRVEYPAEIDISKHFRSRSFFVARGRIAEHPRAGLTMMASGLEEWHTIPEIEAIGERLLRPIEIDHPVVGKMKIDHGINVFEGEMRVGATKVRIMLDANGDQPDAQSDRSLVAIAKDFALFLDQARGFAADKLLALRNSSWAEPGEPPTTRDQFISKLTDPTISLYPDGTLTLDFEAGDLFWGHGVEISGTPDGAFDEASLCG
ncbi:MAG: DUF2262 domain-containing protein [Phycisphaerales bacterium]|nr:DUF2262 domain-containing protein [Planctomycetota bacterium]MCH8509310.1 DUF2262 domain-containing protein [Phycisphaerales bacterium]